MLWDFFSVFFFLKKSLKLRNCFWIELLSVVKLRFFCWFCLIGLLEWVFWVSISGINFGNDSDEFQWISVNDRSWIWFFTVLLLSDIPLVIYLSKMIGFFFHYRFERQRRNTCIIILTRNSFKRCELVLKFQVKMFSCKVSAKITIQFDAQFQPKFSHPPSIQKTSKISN